MLDYGWGNPSSIILPGEENEHSSRSVVFNPYSFANPEHHFAAVNATPHHLAFHNHSPQTHTHHYDTRAYSYSASASSYPPSEQMVGGVEYGTDFNSRIGLNLGGRTYFASSEDDFVNRLYRRSRILEPGSVNCPRCQVEGCHADLTHAKHYHRRHKVCEFHSKAATVIAAGLTQRFCQQCSRFHLLSEFDNGKRSCRKRLADHNRRRRKSQQTTTIKSHAQTLLTSNLARSPPPHSSVAISPPRISLHTAASTTSSVLYSNG